VLQSGSLSVISPLVFHPWFTGAFLRPRVGVGGGYS
jgi:hypothetical protein